MGWKEMTKTWFAAESEKRNSEENRKGKSTKVALSTRVYPPCYFEQMATRQRRKENRRFTNRLKMLKARNA